MRNQGNWFSMAVIRPRRCTRKRWNGMIYLFLGSRPINREWVRVNLWLSWSRFRILLPLRNQRISTIRRAWRTSKVASKQLGERLILRLQLRPQLIPTIRNRLPRQVHHREMRRALSKLVSWIIRSRLLQSEIRRLTRKSSSQLRMISLRKIN